MNKTSHQRFLEDLRRQLTPESGRSSGNPKNRNNGGGETASKEDILRDIRKQFEELFSDEDEDGGES